MKKEIVVGEIENFKSFVESLEVDVEYILPSKHQYKFIIIGKTRDYVKKEDYYYWCMKHNPKVSGRVGLVYSSASWNKVRIFKTEMGAKRNLIKDYETLFNK